MSNKPEGKLPSVSLIGFGEAAQAFVQGWLNVGCVSDLNAFDIKTESRLRDKAAAKLSDYENYGVDGCDNLKATIKDATVIFSVVTADQAHDVAKQAAKHINENAFFFDCNSCSPGSKRKSAGVIEAAGGKYVDAAVMAPVHPKRHQTPILLSGPHADEAEEFLNTILSMSAKTVDGGVGASSTIKMVRSVLMKGLEAVILECVLTGRRAGVDEIVLDSMEKTYPGFEWKKRAAYMMERAATHGIRRAAEMREVANTVRELGFDGAISDATANWEQTIGDMKIDLSQINQEDHGAVADTLLATFEQNRNDFELTKENK